ncbi:MAG: hypothetical protein HY858_00340 [Candidatus Solibacter usitatus]|nr:hypothetical protein [Candidatus Solibacter usitatus]
MSSKIVKAGADEQRAATAWTWRRGAEAREAARPPQAAGPADGDVAEPQREIQSRMGAEIESAFRRGEAAGRQAAASEVDTALAGLARSIEALAGSRARYCREAEREVVAMALAVARRVLRREVQIDSGALLGLVRAAFDSVSLRDITEVRIHPSFSAPLAAHLAAIGAPQSIAVTADPTLELGAVLVETAHGTVDASAETQLDEIGRGFASLPPGRGSGR